MIFQNDLQNLLNAHHEWLLIDAAGKSFALEKTEIEVTFERGRLLVGFLDERGFQTWRVADFQTKDEEISLHLTKNFEKERARIRLVPRARAAELRDSIELARLEKANRLAEIIEKQFAPAKLVRVELNKDHGRFAQIVFEDFGKRQTAVLGDVSESLTPEILLASAILWLVKLGNRRKNPVRAVWIAAEKRQAGKLRKLHALLRRAWKSKIHIKEIFRAGGERQCEATLKDLPALEIADLWRAKAPEIKPRQPAAASAAASEIIALAPAKIDAVFSKNGETLRFQGLPFARVRKVFESESVWFGVGKSRLPLSEDNFAEFTRLLENLRKFRRAGSPSRRHAFYLSAPEAWLEAEFRRNLKLLDANLILSPVHHQFRAGRERVDLLALRTDGRLVIIELKTEPDREMVFQVADYWRQIELQRRAGNLRKARLFGDAEISDAPAICYLAAPTLSFHRDFDFFARTIAPEIEMHRFNLAENWRANLKVLERRAV